ncbi:peptidoglycan-binding domain-containing protein [Alicyclobacillus sp. ALC3]|uniref:peptidoglycan-binding domain-containing protein n=1 Tax=Alicyclobacillus sp. ALC3 TaxID=2796143 RepID=UPI002378C106|nr:peptidoglycan-binding domain-containing protein [Alicyclobacillus sp. ALC3]WDL98299.1 peptidoglycan-binding protein [Alicyclobacillus sp. ALC3]
MSVQGPGANSPARDLQKQLAKERRERRLHRAMITMSWTTPVLAFGGFFTIWHQLSTTLTPYTSKSTASTGSQAGSTATVSSNSPIVLAEGATGQNVEILQYALAQLGYFNHTLTTYYGSVTANAVKAFQQENNLPATGQLDEQTLSALQAALNQTSRRGGESASGSGDDGGYSGSGSGASGGSSSGSYFGSNGGNGGSSNGGSSNGGATVSPPSTQPSVASSASTP